MKSSIFVVIMQAFLFLVSFPVQSMGQEAADAKVSFERKCIACHSAARATSLKKTNEEWTKTVMRMKNRTQSIKADEARVIIDYLTKTYGE